MLSVEETDHTTSGSLQSYIYNACTAKRPCTNITSVFILTKNTKFVATLLVMY